MRRGNRDEKVRREFFNKILTFRIGLHKSFLICGQPTYDTVAFTAFLPMELPISEIVSIAFCLRVIIKQLFANILKGHSLLSTSNYTPGIFEILAEFKSEFPHQNPIKIIAYRNCKQLDTKNFGQEMKNMLLHRRYRPKIFLIFKKVVLEALNLHVPLRTKYLLENHSDS